MSRITTFNPGEVTVSSFDIKYMTINSLPGVVVDEMDNERLLVNQIAPDRFSLIAGKNGLAINASRKQASEMTGVGLFVDDNIYLTGTLYASNIHILGNNLDNSNVERIISAINDYTLPIQSSGMIDSILYNYYMPDFLTIGTMNDSLNNRNSLNISRRANNKIENIQLAIRNQTDNLLTLNSSELLIGTVGDSSYAPAIVMTSIGKPLEFHVSQTRSNINLAYNNHIDYYSNIPNYNLAPLPAASIDTHGCLNINHSNALNLTYNIDPTITVSNVLTRLNVSGTSYIQDIVTYDYTTNDKRHLNDIFVRQRGLTLQANQIFPGEFADGPYTFTSNITVPTIDITHKLYVESNATFASDLTIADTTSNTLRCMVDSYFNKTSYFEDAVFYNLDIVGNISKNGSNINVINVDKRYINYDTHSILNIIPSSIAQPQIVASNISDYLHLNGTSNITEFVNSLGYTTPSETYEIVLGIITNYSIEKAQVLSYGFNTNINFDSSNLIVPGVMGVGVQNNEPYNNVLTINRHSSLNQFSPEILINDIQSAFSIHKVYIGHSRGTNTIKQNNTFSIATNSNKNFDHHIAFYPGAIPTLSQGLIQQVPSLLLMNRQNGISKVGINTNAPRNDVDINLNTLFSSNIYKMYNGQQLQVTSILVGQNNDISLDQNGFNSFNLNVNNLVVQGGKITTKQFVEINSQGIYENVRPIKQHEDGAYFNYGNLSIGFQSDLNPIQNAALQVRNNNTQGDNNTVIRLFDAYDSWNNVDKHTGLEFCQYTNNIHQKWYILNKKDGLNNLTIGYQESLNNDHEMVRMVHNLNNDEIHLNNNSNADNVYIHGSLTVFGNISIEGDNNTYRLHGYELTSNSIRISALTPPLGTGSNYNLAQQEYDILVQANKVVNLVSDNSSYYIGHMTNDNNLINYFALYMNEQNNLINTYQTTIDSRFVVFNRQTFNDLSHQPVAAFKVYPEVSGMTADCRVRLGVLPSSAKSNYYKETTYADLQLLSSMNNLERVGEFRINLYTNTFSPTTAFRIYNYNNLIYYKFADSTIPHISSSLFHIYDSQHTDTLHIQNDSLRSSLLIQNKTNKWRIEGTSDLIITSNTVPLMTIHDGGVGIGNSSPQYSLDIHTTDTSTSNLGSAHLLNTYKSISHLQISSNVNFPISIMNYNPSVSYSSNNGLFMGIEYTIFDYIGYKISVSMPQYLNNFLVNKNSNISATFPIPLDFSNINTDVPFYNNDLSIDISYDIQMTSNTALLNMYDLTSFLQFSLKQNSFNADLAHYNLYYSVDIINNNIIAYTPLKLNVTDGLVLNFHYVTDAPTNLEIYTVPLSTENIAIYIFMKNPSTQIITNDFINNNINSFLLIKTKAVTIPYLTDIYTINLSYYAYDNSQNPYNIDIKLHGTYSIDLNVSIDLIKGMGLSNAFLTHSNSDTYRLHYLQDYGYTSNIDILTQDYGINYSFTYHDVDIVIDRTVTLEYERFANTSNYGIMNVVFNRSKPHIVLESDLTTVNQVTGHYIYSYNGIFEIYASDTISYFNKVFTLDSTGNLTVNSISINELKIAGKTLQDYQDVLDKLKNLQIKSLESIDNVFIKAADTILVNTDIVTVDLKDTMIIDVNSSGSNALTLTNTQDLNSFMYFSNRIEEYYKMGIKDNHFQIFYKDASNPALDIYYDNTSNLYYYQFYGKINYETLNQGEIDIGDLHITNNSIYNSNSSTTDVVAFYKQSKMLMDVNSNDILISVKLIANNGIDVKGGINQISDRRIKRDITPIKDALHKLQGLSGVVYENIMNHRRETGLIAQDVQQVLPEVISTDKEGYLNISYGNMMGFMVEAMKTMKNEIDELKNRVNRLEQAWTR